MDQENDYEPDDFGRDIDALERMLAPHSAEEQPGAAPTAEAEEKRQFFLDSLTAPPSLHAHLEEQLNESGLSDEQKKAGEYIIGNVDENGWLAADVAELSREAGVPEPAVREALAVVQEFDPPGVAARGLKECLLIQLRRSGRGVDSPAARLVAGHLEELGRRTPAELAPAVRVNCIAPGLIKTDFAKALWDNPENLKASTSRSPQKCCAA